MSLNLFRRLDRYDQRIRQLERSEPPEGGGSGGDHVDSDHADAFSALGHAHAGVYAPVEHDTTHDDRFSLLAHVHAVHADSDHDDRFSLLAHTHGAPGAHTHDWGDVTGEPATFPPTPQTLDWLTDVATAGQTTTNVLTYNGTSWVPAAIPAQGWTSITGKPATFPPDEHDTAHDDRFSLLAHTHAAHADSDHDDRFALIEHDSAHSDAFTAIGRGLPAGGTTGQALVKSNDANYQTEWVSGVAPIAQPLNWLTDVSTAALDPYENLIYLSGVWQNGVRELMAGVELNSSTAPSAWNPGLVTGSVQDTGGYPADGWMLSAADPNRTSGFQILTQTLPPNRVYHRTILNSSTFSSWTPMPLPGVWQTSISYGTGWAASTTAGDQAPRYRLEGDTVRLDGSATRVSGSGTTMFTLPSGYRPLTLNRFWVPLGGSASGRIGIAADGVVSQTAGTDFTRTTFDGISFPIT